MSLTSSIGKGVSIGVQAAPKLAELKQATEQFESMFIKDLFKTMRQGHKETLFGKSPGKDNYQDMLDDKIATKTAEGTGVGIAHYLFNATKNNVLLQISSQNNLKTDKVNK